MGPNVQLFMLKAKHNAPTISYHVVAGKLDLMSKLFYLDPEKLVMLDTQSETPWHFEMLVTLNQWNPEFQLLSEALVLVKVARRE